MVSKIKILLGILLFQGISLFASDISTNQIFNFLYKESQFIQIYSWYNYENHESSLLISRQSGRYQVWQTLLTEVSTSFFNDGLYVFRENQVLISNDKLSFPYTFLENEEVKRKQVTIDLETGEILWAKEVQPGIDQDYFYSFADEENYYIYNLSAVNQSQLLCLNQETGSTIWERSSFDEPAAPLQTEKHLILHNSRGNRIAIVDKNTGNKKTLETDSFAILREKTLLYIKQDESGFSVNTYNTENQMQSTIFTMPELIMRDSDDLLAFFADDLLIYQNEMQIKALSIANQGEMIWSYDLEPDSILAMGTKHFDHFSWLGDLYREIPHRSGFYSLSTKYVPLFIESKGDFRQFTNASIVFVDKTNGEELIKSGTYETYGFNYFLLMKSEQFFYLSISPRWIEEEKENYYILKLDGTSGQFAGYCKAGNDWELQQRGETKLHRLKYGFDDYISWKDEGLEDLLIFLKLKQ